MKEGRTIIHLQIKGKHEYYGCLAELFEWHSAEEIGDNYERFLKRTLLTIDKPYINKDTRVIIRKAILRTKSGKRGKYERKKTDEEET